MIFSVFRSHRNRFYWRNGQLHVVRDNSRQQLNQRPISETQEEEEEFRRDIRQWIIFYSVLICIIIAIVIHRVYSNRKLAVK